MDGIWHKTNVMARTDYKVKVNRKSAKVADDFRLPASGGLKVKMADMRSTTLAH